MNVPKYLAILSSPNIFNRIWLSSFCCCWCIWQVLYFGEFPKILRLYYVLFSRAPTRIFSQRMAFLDFKISPFLYRIGCGCLLNAGLHHKQQRVVRGYKSQKIESTYNSFLYYLSDPGIPGPIYGSKSLKLTHRRFWNFTELTLADEDTNSILTDNANRAIQGNVAMQVTQPCGQLCKQWKWHNLVTKFWTNPSCAICWPNLQLMQVVPSLGQICN